MDVLNERNFSRESLISYYNDLCNEYLKTVLVVLEVKKIFSEYNINFFNHREYNKLSELEKEYLEVRELLNVNNIEIINKPCNVYFDLDDILRVICDIRNQELAWINENSFIYYDSEDCDYFGIDLDDEIVRVDGISNSESLILQTSELYDKVIKDVKNRYNDDILTKKKSLA